MICEDIFIIKAVQTSSEILFLLHLVAESVSSIRKILYPTRKYTRGGSFNFTDLVKKHYVIKANVAIE